MGKSIRLPLSGNKSWKAPVANLAALPSSGNTNGDARETLDDNKLYFWNAGSSSWVLGGGGGGGGGNSALRPPCAAIDAFSTTLPAGASPVIDGYSVLENDRILWKALSSGNNRVYVATNVSTSVVWTLAIDGQAGDGSPTHGDTIFVYNGNYCGVRDWIFFDVPGGTHWSDTKYMSNVLMAGPTSGSNLLFDSQYGNHFLINAGVMYLSAPGGTLDHQIYLADGFVGFGNQAGTSTPCMLFFNDNFADIGKRLSDSGLFRPRDLYLGRDAYIGNGLRVVEGTNQRQGIATLVAGTVTVSNTSVTANTRIFLTVQTAGGTQGFLHTTRSAGTSFTIASTNVSETSTVAWLLTEPG